MAKYSIPDLTPQEQRLLDSGAYTEEEILQRRGSVAKSNWGWATQEEAPVAPPVQEPLPRPQPESSLWGKAADVVSGAASELWPGAKSGYRNLVGGMVQGFADDPSSVMPQLTPPGIGALNKLLGAQTLEERAAESLGISDYLSKSSRALNEANAAKDAEETADIPDIPSGELGRVFNENPEGVGKYYGRQLGHSLGFMAPVIAAGVASRGKLLAPMLTMGLMTKASDYGEFRGKGASEEQASLASTGTGVLEGVLGAIPVGIATKPGTGLLKRAIGAAIGEELTEIPTTIGQMATEEAAGITNYTTEDYLRGIRDTALIAGLPGAAGAAIAHPFSKAPKKETESAFLSGQEAANELERIARENDSKKPKIEDDVELANSFVSLNLDDISKMPQFTMDLTGRKFQDDNMVQPTPTETKATPQNRVDELQRQAKEEQLRNMGMPRLPDSLWEGGRQTEPVMPGPFQTQNVEPVPQPAPLTGQPQVVPEVTFNNEFRPPSQLQGKEVLGLKNYDERTGVGTGPVGPANAPTEAPVQPQGMPEEPSMYQQSFTMPPFKQGYDLKLGKDKGKAAPKATPAEEIRSLINSLNNKPKASEVSNDLPVLERQQDTNTFERVVRSQVQNAMQLARVFSGMASTPRAKSMVNALLGAKFLEKVEVRIADSEQDRVLLETMGERGARGIFIPKEADAGKFGAGVILLAPSNWGPTKHGMSPDITYHEVGHAVTHTLLDMAERGVQTTPEIKALVDQLEAIRQEIVEAAYDVAKNDTDVELLAMATENIHEVVSYALTNRRFSQLTSGIRVKGESIGERIKALLTRLATAFGMDFKDANNLMDILFDRALATVKETSKFDPTEIAEAHTINRETGKLGRAAVNKNTRRRLGSVDGADSNAHNWDGGKGQPRFVKRGSDGNVVDELAERRNRLQPDTTEVAEAEEITMESESQPEPDAAYDSKLKLYDNKASAGNVPISQVASKLDKGNVRPIDVGVMDELLRSGSSAEVPLFDQETGREVGATTTGEGETVQGLMGVAAREAANDPGTGPKPAAAKSLKQETFAKGETLSKMPLEGRGPDWSPAGILKNMIWSLFKPSTAAFVNMEATLQHFEEMKQRRGVEFYKIQQALNVMAASNDQANVMAAVEGDQAALKKLNADDAQAVSTFMINMDMLQRELFLKYLQGIKHPTEKDVAVAKKAAESILGPDKYRHRAYAADIKKGGIGVKWVSDVLRNKDKPESLWQKAKEALIRDEFTLPQDINKLKPYEVERAYTHWTLLSPEGKTQQEMKASLEKFKQVNQEGIARRADQLIEVILRLAPSPGQSVSRLYSGGKLDTSIVTPRTKISDEIRALKGEITDPLARLVVTSTRLIDFVAKASFLHNVYEMGKSGGWVFDATDPNVSPQATVAIEGKEFGPFDGTRVTPNLKAILDTAIEVTQSVEFGAQNNIFGALKSGSKNILRYWNKAVITPIKVVTLIGNHAVWAMNLIGGPTTLLSNGNLTGRGVPSVVANSLALTNITKHKEWNALVDDAIKHGTMDSPIFGELYNEQLRDFSSAVANAVFTEKNWRNTVRKKVFTLVDKLSSSKDRVRNAFALMDMGYKLSNGINEYTQLRAAYPDWTEEQVWKVASNRTKMGNYTRDRAIPLAKGADYVGGQMFSTYITEIPRTLVANTLIGVNDVMEGAKTKNPTLITHGMKRLAGVGLATVALKQILTSIAAVAGLTVLGSEDDEEKQRKAEAVRRALPDDYQNSILAPTAVNKDGVLTLQAIDRADFHGAWNSVFRAAAKVAAGEEPPEFLGNELSNLMYMHSIFGALTNERKGWFGRENPEAYETTFKKLTTDLGLFSLSPENANRLINTGSLLIPKTLTRTVLPALRNIGKAEEDKEPVYWTGFKPIEYDPKRELMFSLDAYNGALNGGKSELGKIISGTGTKMDKAGLEVVYNRAIADELEAFDRVYRKINGARAMGFDDQQIAQMLVLGKMRRDYIPYVMSGRFIPRPFGERYLESAMVDNAFSNETPKRKEEIQKKLAEAKVYLEQLRGEYVHGRLN